MLKIKAVTKPQILVKFDIRTSIDKKHVEKHQNT